MTEVRFVSTNPGKVREVRAVLAPYGVRVRWSRRRLAEPQAETLEEVARHKLSSVPASAGYVLVEDSGLFVRSLGGFPGVYSAHILKLWGFGPLLELVRRRDPTASFRTVAALRHGRRVWLFAGEVRGRLSRRAVGRHGFGYDPIFVPDGFRRTLGELPSTTKDRISHRAEAMRRVGAFLARRERSGSTTDRSGRRPGRKVRARVRKGRKRFA